MAGIWGALASSNISYGDQSAAQSAGMSGGFENYGQMGDTGEVLFTSGLDSKNMLLYIGIGALLFLMMEKGK